VSRTRRPPPGSPTWRPASPKQHVTDSQFEYTASQVSFSTGDDQTPFPPAPDQTHLRQVWIPVADLCGPGLLIEHGQKISISESSVAQAVPGFHGDRKEGRRSGQGVCRMARDRAGLPESGIAE